MAGKSKIVYEQWEFTDNAIKSGSVHLAMPLISDALETNTFTATVECTDKNIINFERNTPLTYYYNNKKKGIFYVQSITRAGPKTYAIYATSAIGLLIEARHYGGIYTGQTVPEVVAEICGSLPVHVKTIFADTALYGWLPYVKPPESSARDNLAQVLFAIGAYLGVDQEGVLRVEPLWDGVSSAVPADRVYLDGSVEYGSAVSAVSVLEHQYLALNTEKSTTLFDGTTTANTTVIFDEPMFNLQATGFSILESGANYAILSAGTGTLTGIPYLHTTREVVRSVTQGAAENIRTISDATLVSLVNSRAVAERLAEYYKHTVTIHNPILAESERPGQVVSIYDPFAKTMVEACISSMDINMSAVLKAETAALVGFEPPQPDTSEYMDERVVLTGAGDWQPPDGVTTVRYTLLSGAFGGSAGRPGEDGASPESYTNRMTDYTESGYLYGEGGKGGEGGQPGSGGRILQGELQLDGNAPIPYQCGIGGEGSSEPDQPGQEGTPTTFGGVSSADGTVSDAGYTDPVTGEVFAQKGKAGIPGGDGAGKVPGATYPPDEPEAIQLAGGVTDEDGIFWPGGTTSTYTAPGEVPPKISTESVRGQGVYATSSAGLGSGAAAGSAGTDGGGKGYITASSSSPYARANGARGKDGAAATKIPKTAGITTGGTGGYGGGGGSACGASIVGVRTDVSNADAVAYPGTPGVGGAGAPGGRGGDGMIILYFRRPKPAQALLASVTKDGLWRLDKYGRRIIV